MPDGASHEQQWMVSMPTCWLDALCIRWGAPSLLHFGQLLAVCQGIGLHEAYRASHCVRRHVMAHKSPNGNEQGKIHKTEASGQEAACCP